MSDQKGGKGGVGRDKRREVVVVRGRKNLGKKKKEGQHITSTKFSHYEVDFPQTLNKP